MVVSKSGVDVSIVLPVFNCADYLAHAVESVILQTMDSWELLIVDDGSKDDSARIATRYATGNDRIQLVRHPGDENRGVAASRKLGVDCARGEFVAFLDADDCFRKDKLERQLAIMREHPEVVLCHTNAAMINSSSELCGSLDNPFLFGARDQVYDRAARPDRFERNGICNSSAMIRRSVIQADFFMGNQVFQNEDFFFWLALSRFGSFAYLVEPLVQYRVHDANFSVGAISNGSKWWLARIEMLTAYWASSHYRLEDRRALREALERAIVALVKSKQSRSEGEPPSWNQVFCFAGDDTSELACRASGQALFGALLGKLRNRFRRP